MKTGKKKKKGNLCCTAIKKVSEVVFKKGSELIKCEVGKKLPMGLGTKMVADNCKAGKGSASDKKKDVSDTKSDGGNGDSNSGGTNSGGSDGPSTSSADFKLSKGLAYGRGVGRGRTINNFSPNDFQGDWWASQEETPIGGKSFLQ